MMTYFAFAEALNDNLALFLETHGIKVTPEGLDDLTYGVLRLISDVEE